MVVRRCRGICARTGMLIGRGTNLNYVRADTEPRVSPRITPRMVHPFRMLALFASSWAVQPWRDVSGTRTDGFGREEAWSPISDALSLFNISRITVRYNSLSLSLSRASMREAFSSGRISSALYFDEAAACHNSRFTAVDWADSASGSHYSNEKRGANVRCKSTRAGMWKASRRRQRFRAPCFLQTCIRPFSAVCDKPEKYVDPREDV